MSNIRDKIRDKTNLILIDFLHDVKAVNWTAGNEIDIDEKNYGDLADIYARKVEKLNKSANQIKGQKHQKCLVIPTHK